MNITKADIDSLPLDWAAQLAGELDPDCDLMRCGYDPYDILRANWPECREEVEDMLASLNDLESNCGN